MSAIPPPSNAPRATPSNSSSSNSIQAEINQLESTLHALYSQMNSARSGSSGFKDEVESCLNQINQLRGQRGLTESQESVLLLLQHACTGLNEANQSFGNATNLQTSIQALQSELKGPPPLTGAAAQKVNDQITVETAKLYEAQDRGQEALSNAQTYLNQCP